MKIGILLVVIMIHSCKVEISNNKTRIIDHNVFPIEIKVSRQATNIVFLVESMGIVDTLLILIQSRLEKQIHIYNLKNLEEIVAFGYSGKGPLEFTQAQFYNQFEIDQEGINLWFFDINFRRLHLENINSRLSGQDPLRQKVIVPMKAGIESGLFYISEDSIIGSSHSNKGSIFHIDPITGSINWNLVYQGVEMEKPTGFGFLLRNEIRISPDKSGFAMCYWYYKQVDIFDDKINHKLSIVYAKDRTKSIRQNQRENDIIQDVIYFPGIYTTDEKIYLLYTNCSYDEYYSGSFKSEIHVFNWDGSSLMKIITDDPIWGFSIDESHSLLYAYLRLNDTIMTYSLTN